MFIVKKLQWNTMAGCNIHAKKEKKWDKNIKSSAVKINQNAVKRPGSIVSVLVVYACDIYDLQIIQLKG